MNDQTKVMNEQLKTMNEQWQGGLEAGREQWATWNHLWLEGTRASMDAWMNGREAWSKMAVEVAERASEMAMQEQKVALEWMERGRTQMNESLEQTTKLWGEMSDAGQQWSRETGKTLQAQADVVSEQVEEWLATANVVAEKSPAKTTRTAKSTNGSKSAKVSK